MMLKSILFLTLFIYHSSAYAMQPGDSIPLCEAKMMRSGLALDLSQYKNKVLLIDFWATWCPPCKQSMPFLNALRNELQEKGFEIIAINVDEKSQDAQDFLDRFPVDYTVAFDPEGLCPARYGVQAMPSSYFIDRQGKVRHIHLGFRQIDEAEIRAQVIGLLMEGN